MISVEVKDSGWKNMKKKPSEDLYDKALNHTNKACMIIKTEAKLYAPWKTGTLRRSIIHEIQEKKGSEIVGRVFIDPAATNPKGGRPWEYGVYVEYKIPFMRPAFDQNVRRIMEIFRGK